MKVWLPKTGHGEPFSHNLTVNAFRWEIEGKHHATKTVFTKNKMDRVIYAWSSLSNFGGETEHASCRRIQCCTFTRSPGAGSLRTTRPSVAVYSTHPSRFCQASKPGKSTSPSTGFELSRRGKLFHYGQLELGKW